jgi:predicted NACHT family NTPase
VRFEFCCKSPSLCHCVPPCWLYCILFPGFHFARCPISGGHYNPLKNKRKHRALIKYLENEREGIFGALMPGFTDLRVGDIVGSGDLFIPLPWKIYYGDNQSEDLVGFLIDSLSQDNRVLLLGEAGQGKTTILKRVFTIMVNRFMTNHRGHKLSIPVYIPLREFTFSGTDEVQLLWAHLRKNFPLAFEDFAFLTRNNQITFLFDGFDEIKGDQTQTLINENAASGIFSHSAILSCRKNFYEFYLSTSVIQESYSIKVELRPLEINDFLAQYITEFCRRKYRTALQVTPPGKIIETIQESRELRDLAQRPLLLIMILDIFTNPHEMRETEWNMAKLYKKYTEKWLKNEAAKAGSALKWEEKAALMEELAWSIYVARAPSASAYGLYEATTFTRNELSNFLKRRATYYRNKLAQLVVSRYRNKLDQLIEDICLRTFLIITSSDQYYFIHKSFQEYYVAKYIFECIRDIDFIIQALQELIPVEVSTFLREMLSAKDLSRCHAESCVMERE